MKDQNAIPLSTFVEHLPDTDEFRDFREWAKSLGERMDEYLIGGIPSTAYDVCPENMRIAICKVADPDSSLNRWTAYTCMEARRKEASQKVMTVATDSLNKRKVSKLNFPSSMKTLADIPYCIHPRKLQPIFPPLIGVDVGEEPLSATNFVAITRFRSVNIDPRTIKLSINHSNGMSGGKDE